MLMADDQLRAFLRRLRHSADPAGVGALTDGQLLERFATGRDEAAFEVLLWRHGPMVLDVCHRLLGRSPDAEDAFQAAFLALVRKAHAIAKREAVGSWLYRVAYRAALRARADAAKRRHRERTVAELAAVTTAANPA